MLIRKSKFNTENKSIWYVLIIFLSIFIFMIIGMLISKFTKVENGTSLICMIIIVIQYFYVFKNIEDVKINQGGDFMIKLVNLNKEYKDKKIFKNLNLEIKKVK